MRKICDLHVLPLNSSKIVKVVCHINKYYKVQQVTILIFLLSLIYQIAIMTFTAFVFDLP